MNDEVAASALDLVRQGMTRRQSGLCGPGEGGRPWLGHRSAFLLTRTSNASFSACCTFDLTLARLNTGGD